MLGATNEHKATIAGIQKADLPPLVADLYLEILTGFLNKHFPIEIERLLKNQNAKKEMFEELGKMHYDPQEVLSSKDLYGNFKFNYSILAMILVISPSIERDEHRKTMNMYKLICQHLMKIND